MTYRNEPFGRRIPGIRLFKQTKFAALVLSAFTYAVCQDQPQTSLADLQKEAAVWQQKIKDVESRIVKKDGEVADEVRAFRAYLRTEAAHKAQFQKQNDSLEHDIAAAKNRVDSLDRVAEGSKLGGVEADNRVEEMRVALLAACDDLKDFYGRLPPGNIRTTSVTLDFLKAELESKTVTVSEAIERYWQILGSLDEAESSMETYAGSSPVPEITGQADFIRIGLAYLAAIDDEGEAAYLWVPDNTGGGWQVVTDLNAKAALRDAVLMRARKIVPRIVDLPFSHPVKVRSIEDADGENRGSGQ